MNLVPFHIMKGRLLLAVTLLLIWVAPGASQTPDAPLTLVSREGQQTLPTVTFNGSRMVDLDDLMAPFDLTIAPDQRPERLTIIRDEQVIILTPDVDLITVDGRLVSLPSPPIKRAGIWYVPIDFIGRALALVHDQGVELRRRSGLVLIGGIRVPQVIGRYQRTGPQANLRLIIAPATEFSVEQDENRLIIAFEAEALDLVLPEIFPDELVKGIRGAQTPPALVVELGARFGTYGITREPAIGGGVELIIDLQPTPITSTLVAPPAAPSPSLINPSTPGAADSVIPTLPELESPRTIRAIAIDPGHGGDDTGTRGPDGTLEKEITLKIARLLRNKIENELGLRVVLTRTTDTTVAMDERAAIANNNRADLFISLHTNASIRQSVTGAEVFYLSLAEYDEETHEAVELDDQPVPVVGGGSRSLDIVPWEMAQLRHVSQSTLWAATIADELSLRVPMSPRGLQQAPFRVLVGANMPAVLVEMGFLSNPVQEAQLTSTTFQTAIVNGLLKGIIRYRDELSRDVPSPTLTGSVPPGGSGRNQRRNR
jgi:N-acetylmuramoyl-L-alanine amidase